MMIEHIPLPKILFLDIETVSGHASYTELSEPFQALWSKKAASLLRTPLSELDEEEIANTYTERAGIFAEFGKIVCISVGGIGTEGGQPKMVLKSFAGADEHTLLKEFVEFVEKKYGDPRQSFFCGHNIKEFDIPYICRRLMINGFKLPASLDVRGKKPWETAHFLDTMELWKFGEYKSFTSLRLLTALFGIPSPKDDIDGSEVGRVYWEENGINRIVRYCEKDVVATAQVFLSYRRETHLTDEQVESKTEGLNT
jgi:DNA polymerase elongation subunit (family B)